MKSDNNTKYIVFVSLSILMLLIVVSSLTYAYFTAQLNNLSDLTVNGSFSQSMSPVFTSHSSGDISLMVSTSDMLETGASPQNNTIADQASSNLEVTLLSNGTCTFDIILINTGTAYIPSANASAAGLKEYTLMINDSNGNVVVSEEAVNVLMENAVNGEAIIANDLSITSTGELVVQNYTVTATIYNLNVVQNIYNKNYSNKVSVSGIECA